jgi:uncharacterized cupredoxin-like copper-binding protein
MRGLAVAVIAVLALVSGCGGDDSEPAEESTAAPAKTFEVVGTDFKLEPSTISVEQEGTYRFRFVNRGQTEHALEVEGKSGEKETQTIGPGETAELTIELEEGEYELYCPVGDHKDRGMDGSVVVGAGAGTRTTETGEDSGRDEGGTDY